MVHISCIQFKPYKLGQINIILSAYPRAPIYVPFLLQPIPDCLRPVTGLKKNFFKKVLFIDIITSKDWLLLL